MNIIERSQLKCKPFEGIPTTDKVREVKNNTRRNRRRPKETVKYWIGKKSHNKRRKLTKTKIYLIFLKTSNN